MGTTSPKNLRYPEPTTEARTLHTQVKNLADDANNVLINHDARFTNLDAKTDQTNSNLSSRNTVISRYGNCAGVFTHLPNDGVLRTVSQHTDQFYVPAAATRAHVSVMNTAFCNVNCAGAWYPLVNFGNTGWQGFGEYVVHNQTEPGVDLGFQATAEFNVEAYDNVWSSIAVNGYCAPQSGNWITCGYMRWNVTLLG